MKTAAQSLIACFDAGLDDYKVWNNEHFGGKVRVSLKELEGAVLEAPIFMAMMVLDDLKQLKAQVSDKEWISYLKAFNSLVPKIKDLQQQVDMVMTHHKQYQARQDSISAKKNRD